MAAADGLSNQSAIQPVMSLMISFWQLSCDSPPLKVNGIKSSSTVKSQRLSDLIQTDVFFEFCAYCYDYFCYNEMLQ